MARPVKGTVSAATPPDRVESRPAEGRTRTAPVWDSLVRPGVNPPPPAKTVQVYASHDPGYAKPWRWAPPLALQPGTGKAIDPDRWPVEQLPLAAQPRVGAHRPVGPAPDSSQRLPELALLAGSILSCGAATVPVTPTGFWDTQPKRTPGRLRRRLRGQPLPQRCPLPEQFRKKAAVTAHLPKAIDAVRSPIARARDPAVPMSLPFSGPI